VTLLTVSTVKGAPGATTVALLLAQHFAGLLPKGPTCVLADCDVSGGDLAPILGLPAVPGLASLALAARHGLTLEQLIAHTQPLARLSGLRALLGVAGPEQGSALKWIWKQLGVTLADPAVLAVADLGRVGADDRHCELGESAVTNLLVTNDGIAALLHAKAACESAERSGRSLSIVVAGHRRWPLSHIAEATCAEVLGAVRFDASGLSSVVRTARRGRIPIRRRPDRHGALRSDVEALGRKVADRSGLAELLTPSVPDSASVPPSPRGRLAGSSFRRQAESLA
jgi:hypothetical protein